LVPLVHGAQLRVAVVAHENVFRSMVGMVALTNATAFWAHLAPDGTLTPQRLMSAIQPPLATPHPPRTCIAVVAIEADHAPALVIRAMQQLTTDPFSVLVALGVEPTCRPAYYVALSRAVQAFAAESDTLAARIVIAIPSSAAADVTEPACFVAESLRRRLTPLNAPSWHVSVVTTAAWKQPIVEKWPSILGPLVSSLEVCP
jgi:hypothetical protein